MKMSTQKTYAAGEFFYNSLVFYYYIMYNNIIIYNKGSHETSIRKLFFI